MCSDSHWSGTVGWFGQRVPCGRLDHVGRRLEALGRAVPALVGAEVDVAVGVGPADHLLGGPDVVRVGRPDEAVGADEQRVLGRPEERDVLVDEGLAACMPSSAARWAMLTECSSVPVRKRVSIALHPVPARQDVRPDDLVQGVEAGPVVGVGDGRS